MGLEMEYFNPYTLSLCDKFSLNEVHLTHGSFM